VLIYYQYPKEGTVKQQQEGGKMLEVSPGDTIDAATRRGKWGDIKETILPDGELPDLGEAVFFAGLMDAESPLDKVRNLLTVLADVGKVESKRKGTYLPLRSTNKSIVHVTGNEAKALGLATAMAMEDMGLELSSINTGELDGRLTVEFSSPHASLIFIPENPPDVPSIGYADDGCYLSGWWAPLRSPAYYPRMVVPPTAPYQEVAHG